MTSRKPSTSIPIGSTPMPTRLPSSSSQSGLGVDAEHAQARRAEVACVVTDLEADVVGAEHAAQELLSRGQQPVHLGRRERDVQEEPDREPRLARPQHRRDEHEVEVVHPDARVGLAVLDDRVGEALVDLDVPRPRLGRDAQPPLEVVEERPERVVADLPVEVLLLVRRQEHRVQVILGEPRAHALLSVGGTTAPGQPTQVASPRNGVERGRQAAGAPLHAHGLAVDREADRQAVARDDEPVVCGVPRQLSSLYSIRGRYNLRVRE